MSEESKKRSVSKGVLTKAYRVSRRLLVEKDLKKLSEHRTRVMDYFQKFHVASEAYEGTLTDESNVSACETYYDEVLSTYEEEMQKLNDAIDALNISPPVSESSDAEKTLAAVSQVINMPPLVLDPFDGDHTKFHQFMAMFAETIEKTVTSQTLRLTRLLCHTTGKAKHAISTVDINDPSCYDQAVAILKRDFGNKYVICTAVIKKLKDGSVCKTSGQLKDFANELSSAKISLEREKMYSEIDNQTAILAITKRLPVSLQNKWANKTTEHQQTSHSYLTFADFVTFVGHEALKLNDPIFGRDIQQLDCSCSSKKHTSSFSVTVDKQNNQTKKSNPNYACLCCGKPHKFFYCDEFRQMTFDKRNELVKI